MTVKAASETRVDVSALGAGFRGEVLVPGEARYEEARPVWNGSIDRWPAVIARCTGVADVRAALRFARERELLIAVRGGGHSVAGLSTCDGGLMLDLSPMRGIRVDVGGRTARVEAGVLWGELDRETQAFGLATPGGIVTHTGIAGLTLGGGIGWLMRKLGATADNLLSADVVTADGELLVASEGENADLFWGLRGGGGNFGIVTSFEFRLHLLGPIVLAGPVYYALEDAPAVLRSYRDWAADAPDEVTTIVSLRRAPAVPFLPESVHGRPVVVVAACYAGPVEDGERVVRPLRELATPLVDLLAPKPYVAHQSMFDPTVPHGWHYYWKSWELPPLADEVIDVLIAQTEAITSPLSYCIVFQLGGAVARVRADETAYSQREAAHDLNINAAWLPDDPAPERHVQWARDVFDAVEPHTGGRVYVNFLGDEGSSRVKAAYGEAKYQRLVALKRRYDPENTFRLNQNIAP